MLTETQTQGPVQADDADGRSPSSPRKNEAQTPHICWHPGLVSADVRQSLLRQRPVTVWLTGLSGAGKSTIAGALEKDLLGQGQCCYVLDGDNLRHHLNRDLGFSVADRRENIRRAAEVAYLMNEAGLIVIAALISPFSDDRKMACDIIGKDRFIEVFVSTSTEVCEARDPKGLYQKARNGEIPEFTGISSPYESPQAPAMELNTEIMSVNAASSTLYEYLAKQSLLR
ncbi:adenylyl-sulfate kinase [Undibacterium sp.]|jgi:adenylylsulfate kinase|uniref:adenylyl-sulfate kinase n=1 Tax=Undibacterium sp. TaxID=1914977 RepID=UPI002C61B5A5|nr:adenylyl-sulfate kinase [Undibacterium sp.]HTD04221.1 adenylyl-sulfate kinase [Undibacterium sp.]